MARKVIFAFLLLIIAAFLPDIFAHTTIAGFFKCLAKCPKHKKHPICAFNGGKYVTFGRKEYNCLKENCQGGGLYQYDGKCDKSRDKPGHPLKNVTPEVPNTNAAPGTPNTNAATGVSNANAAPEVSNTNAAPGTPNTNAAPGVPNTNAAPGASNTNAAPGVSNTNAAPGVSNTNAGP